MRRLTPEEVRALESEVNPWRRREGELCLVLESEATWTVGTASSVTSRVAAPAAMSRLELFPVLMLLAGMRDRRGRLRAPHVVWSRKSPYFFLGGDSGGGVNPNLQWRTSDFYDGVVTPSVAQEAYRYFRRSRRLRQRRFEWPCTGWCPPVWCTTSHQRIVLSTPQSRGRPCSALKTAISSPLSWP